MADDIRLVINVEKKGVLSAITATENLEKKVKKLSDTYAREGITSSQYANGISQIAKAAKVSQVDLFALGKAIRYNSDALKAEAIAKKASADADKLYAQARRDATQEDQRRASVIKSNIAALNEQRIATQKNSSELKSFRTSTDAVYAAEQKLLRLKKLLRTEVENGNMTMRQAAAVQMQYKQSLNGMGGGLTQTKNKMSSMGVVTQQAGYQLGDFIVQVQGGQSAFIAFSQQATQMVGFLPLMAARLGLTATAAIGLSAALGIGIPLVTSLAMVLLTASKSSKKAEESQDDLKKSVDSVLESLRDANDEWAEFQAGLAKGQTGFVDQIAAAAQEVRDAHALLATLTANLPKEANLGGMGLAGSPTYDLTGLRAYIFGNGELEDAIDRVAAAEERHNEFKRLSLRISEQSAQTESNNIRDRMTLLRVEQEFGEDSLELRAAAFKQEIAIFEQEQKREGLSATLIQGLVDQLQAEEDLKLEMIATAKATQEFLDKLFSIDFSSAITGANKLANEMSRAAGNAWDFMVANTKRIEAGRKLPLDDLAAQYAQYGAGRKAFQEEASSKRYSADSTYEGFETSISKATKTKGAGFNADEYLNGLIKEAKLKTSLIGLSEQEAAKKTLLHTLEEKGINLNDDRVKVLIEEQKSLDELEKAYAKQQEMVGMFKDTITNALTSIIDGSKSVAGAFKDMIRQMLTSLAQSKFIQPLVAGMSAGFAGTAVAGSGMMAGIGAGMGTLGAGLYAGGATALGFGGAASVGTAGAAATGALGSAGMAIGAVAAPLLAVAAAISFFKKKTKELDSGINVTVKNMDTYVESWKKIETKRFWGLSKKVRTQMEAASAEISNPITEAILGVQTSVFNMADYIGIATGALDKFTYDFKLSLKGLTEDQQMAKITEELTKLGDSFSALLPNVSSMAELTAIYQERLGLETRLLQVQGDTEALRQIELSSVNDYNKSLLQQIYDTEDAKSAMDALNESLNALSENDYATMLDFQRAQASIRMGLPAANSLNAPAMPASASSGVAAITGPMASTSAEIVQLRSEMKEMHKEAMFAYSKLIKNGKDSRDTLRSWDVVGLPAERTA